MTLSLDYMEVPGGVDLVWAGAVGDDPVENPNGVRSPHMTRVVSGAVRFEFADGRPSRLLMQDESIQLPVGVGYRVFVVADATVRCAYRGNAVDEIRFLRDPNRELPARGRIRAALRKSVKLPKKKAV